MDEEEIGRDISEVSDDELREIVFEEAEICDPETVNAAKAELERRKNLPDQRTVSMNERNRENCIQTVDEGKKGWDITKVSEDEKEIGQDIAEVSEDDLRDIVFKEADTCDTETVNAAKAELERRKNILDLSPGKTVLMGQLIGNLNREKCIRVLEKISPKENFDSYYDLMDLCSRLTSSSNCQAKIQFQKTADGKIKLTVVSASRTFKFSQFSYDEWIAMQIDKQDIIRFGEDIIIALCLLNMKKSSSEPQDSESCLVVCPKCGTVLEPDELFCPECGWKLPSRKSAEQQPMEMKFCPECGAKLKADQPFCANCGAHVLSSDALKEIRVSSTQYSALHGPAKATGGLKVWLWISIIASVIAAVYYVVGTNLTMGTLHAIGIESGVDGIYKATMCCGLILAAIVIFGDFRLLKGYKIGFYIICICTIISLVVFLILNINAIHILNKSMEDMGIYSPSYDGTNMISNFIIELVAAAGGIGILWLFLRKQWMNFR